MKHLVPLLVLSAAVLAACEGFTVPRDEDIIVPGLSIERAEGDQQGAPAGTALPGPVVVRVKDATGRGVPDVPVRFVVTSGGGWVVTTDDVLTDASGRASAVWYIGPVPESNNVLVAQSPVGAVGFRGYAWELDPGETYRGSSGYIEMTAGSLPVVLSAAHGGSLRPEGMRDGPAAEGDPYTIELVREVATALEAGTGAAPTVVISNLDPSKLDVDRPVDDARADSAAWRAWREYHGFMAAARAHLDSRSVRGLVIDVHGHASTGARPEIGYLLTAAELAVPDATLNQSTYVQRSSVRELGGQYPLARVIRGPNSIGGLLDEHGVPAVPSASMPSPDHDDYVSGGFSVERYSSRDGGLVSAVSLQVPEAWRASPSARSTLAEALASALDRFFATFYDGALGQSMAR